MENTNKVEEGNPAAEPNTLDKETNPAVEASTPVPVSQEKETEAKKDFTTDFDATKVMAFSVL